jgi:hypothetical protein
MYGSSVTPNTAGMESKANSTSVVPIATSTSSIGVKRRRPSRRIDSRLPWYSSVSYLGAAKAALQAAWTAALVNLNPLGHALAARHA